MNDEYATGKEIYECIAEDREPLDVTTAKGMKAGPIQVVGSGQSSTAKAVRLVSLLSLEIVDLVADGKLDVESADELFDIIGDNPVHPNPNPDFTKGLKALIRKIKENQNS
jgi:hypothetical protein